MGVNWKPVIPRLCVLMVFVCIQPWLLKKLLIAVESSQESKPLPYRDDADNNDDVKKDLTAYEIFMKAQLYSSSNTTGVLDHSRCASINRNNNIAYSTMRTDRSGSVITNMLLSHSLALNKGWTYGGACPTKDTSYPKRKHREVRKRIKEHSLLLASVGLEKDIQINCPASPTSINTMCKIPNYNDMPEPKNSKTEPLFSQKYLNELERIMTKDFTNRIEQEDRITVHIRRGDASPIAEKDLRSKRYLPNLYYKNLIKRYKKEKKYKNFNVTIHSESESFESFDTFHQLGCTVRLDASVDAVWKDILTSKIIIMSRGHFSLIPSMLATALFGRNVVVIQPPPPGLARGSDKHFKTISNSSTFFSQTVTQELDRLKSFGSR